MDFGILLTVWPALLRGTLVTIQLTVMVLLIATPLGVLLAILRGAKSPFIRFVMATLSGVLRGTPPLLVLFFVFFGLPFLGITLPAFPSAVVGMTLYMAFYFAEGFRSGLQSVPAGQYQAAAALGLPRGRALFRIILPQSLPAALPPYISHATEVLKGSALAAGVAVPELANAAKQVFVVTYQPFPILLAAAAIYAVLDGLLIALQFAGERWASRRRATR